MSIEHLLSASMPASAYGAEPLTIGEVDAMMGGDRVWRTIDAIKDHYANEDEERKGDTSNEHREFKKLFEDLRDKFDKFALSERADDFKALGDVLTEIEQEVEDKWS